MVEAVLCSCLRAAARDTAEKYELYNIEDHLCVTNRTSTSRYLTDKTEDAPIQQRERR